MFARTGSTEVGRSPKCKLVIGNFGSDLPSNVRVDIDRLLLTIRNIERNRARVSGIQSARIVYDNDLHKFQLRVLRTGPRYINKNFQQRDNTRN